MTEAVISGGGHRTPRGGGENVPDLFSLPAALKALDNVHAGSLLAAQQGREGGGGSGGARILAQWSMQFRKLGLCPLAVWSAGLFTFLCCSPHPNLCWPALWGIQPARVSALGCEFPPGGLTIHSPGWAPRADLGLGAEGGPGLLSVQQLLPGMLPEDVLTGQHWTGIAVSTSSGAPLLWAPVVCHALRGQEWAGLA